MPKNIAAFSKISESIVGRSIFQMLVLVEIRCLGNLVLPPPQLYKVCYTGAI